jgi:hypothetical protein
MKRQNNGHGGWSATMIAKLCDVSPQYINRKLAEGRKPFDIIVEIGMQQQKRGQFMDLPSIPVPVAGAAANGYADLPLLSYSQALRRKENSLADLRMIEVEERRGRLIPKVYVRKWALGFMHAAREILERLPGELADELAAESDVRKVKQILETAVARVIAAFREHNVERDLNAATE